MNRTLYFHLVILVGCCFCNIGMAEVNSHQISQGETPEGLTQSEWNNIQAQITIKQYKFLPQFQQQAYLKSFNPDLGDNFGFSVAISGDTLVVGAFGEESSTYGVDSLPNDLASQAGAAYVFVRNEDGLWAQESYLKASNTDDSDQFGYSVAISGDTVVIGANGEDSSTIGVNSIPNESENNSGAAYVFIRNESGFWSQQAYLKASNSDSGDSFGYSVSISGDTIVIGALWEDSLTAGVNNMPNEMGSNSGAAYVFNRNGNGAWSQQAFLKASNRGISDEFGRSVSVSGGSIVVGAHNEASSTTGVNSTPNNFAQSAGAAYVFIRDEFGIWSQQAYLKASNSEMFDSFGFSVAIYGEIVVVGAHNEASSTTGVNSTPNEMADKSGAAYVFLRNESGNWNQQAYLKASNTESNDKFGWSVAVSGENVVVGAYVEDSSTTGVNSTPNELANASGAVYVFNHDIESDIWSELAYLKALNTGVEDFFGFSVAISDDMVVAGANREDSSTTGVNSIPNELAYNSGAAYVFIAKSDFIFTNGFESITLKVLNYWLFTA